MDLSRPLSVVTTSVDGDVLAALALSDAWFTPRRLHAAIGRYSEDGVRRSLRRLVDQGIVDDQEAGRAVLYKLNRLHLAAPAVVELANLWSTFVLRVEELVGTWSIEPKVVALFGSAARRSMGPESDIDILLVEPVTTSIDQPQADRWWRDRVEELERSASRWTGNDVRVLAMSESHVREHAADEPVLHDVVSEGVRIAGDFDWFRRLVTQARRERA